MSTKAVSPDRSISWEKTNWLPKPFLFYFCILSNVETCLSHILIAFLFTESEDQRFLYQVKGSRWLRKICKFMECNPNIKVFRRYGSLRGPTFSSCGGLWLWLRLFFALRAKRSYYAVLAHFSTFLVSSSNLGSF